MSPSITQFLICAAYLLSLCAALVWTQDCRCGLPGTIVKFKTCTKKPAAWRSHDHPDINLTGDCLPEVPVKWVCYVMIIGYAACIQIMLLLLLLLIIVQHNEMLQVENSWELFDWPPSALLFKKSIKCWGRSYRWTTWSFSHSVFSQLRPNQKPILSKQ